MLLPVNYIFFYIIKQVIFIFLELKKAEEKIQELIKQKLEMEETLYYKFLNLLNSKKDKIR